jgi:hypothetical protein
MTGRHRFLVFGFSFWAAAERSKASTAPIFGLSGLAKRSASGASCSRPLRSPAALFGVAAGLEIRDGEAAQAVFVEPPESS